MALIPGSNLALHGSQATTNQACLSSAADHCGKAYVVSCKIHLV